ncbi:MAG: hypothetical protein LUH54_02130 [Firmicutes bacterium]|nr:hypothetical protein [Bacillota bacterium]
MKKLLTALICAAMMMCAFGCADSTCYSTDYSTGNSTRSAGTSAGDGSAAEQTDAATEGGDSTADAEDYSYFTGHVIETCVSADGAYTDNVFFIALSEKSWYDENTIIMMKEKDVDFGGLKTGDCIRIKVLTVEESYPLQAAVYDFELLSSNGYDSVPLESISEVESCGYTVKSATE